MRQVFRSVCLASLSVMAFGTEAATLVATYSFNDTLNPSFGIAPALVAINPSGNSLFETATVNGVSQRVYRWDGSGNSPTLNAGFSLNTTGLVQSDNYSVEMVFEFIEPPAFGNGWRRILDTQNRQSDNGFYVSPQNVLQVYNVVSGTTTFTTPGFHTVVLTNFVVGGIREVKAYLDGRLELVSNTDQLNLNNPNNPGRLLNFFVDNLSGPAQLEFADGRIASLSLYDGIFVPVPEVNSAALLCLGISSLALFMRRRTICQSKHLHG